MAVGGVTNLIYSMHHRVDRGVKSNAVICAIQIVINGSGYANHGNPMFFRQGLRTPETPITANHHQGINPVRL